MGVSAMWTVTVCLEAMMADWGRKRRKRDRGGAADGQEQLGLYTMHGPTPRLLVHCQVVIGQMVVGNPDHLGIHTTVGTHYIGTMAALPDGVESPTELG